MQYDTRVVPYNFSGISCVDFGNVCVDFWTGFRLYSLFYCIRPIDLFIKKSCRRALIFGTNKIKKKKKPSSSNSNRHLVIKSNGANRARNSLAIDHVQKGQVSNGPLLRFQRPKCKHIPSPFLC